MELRLLSYLAIRHVVDSIICQFYHFPVAGTDQLRCLFQTAPLTTSVVFSLNVPPLACCPDRTALA